MACSFDFSGTIWRFAFSDVLTLDDLTTAAMEASRNEVNATAVRNRLIDLRQLSGIDVSFTDINAFAGHRRAVNLPNNVRSALLVGNNLQFGFARMYQTVLEHPQISLQIFKDENEALQWLSTNE